jgi:hypothetical protein
MSAALQTIPYWGYAFGEAVQDAYEKVLTPGSSHVSYSGLSPFEIPDSVYVEVHSDNRLVFKFQYPNDEPSEGTKRAVTHDGEISVELGVNSRKVISLEVVNAYEKLQDPNGIDFDQSLASSWQAGLPLHSWNTSRRNLHVIRGILISLPRDFKQELGRALRSQIAR